MAFSWSWEPELTVLRVILRGALDQDAVTRDAAERLLASGHWPDGLILIDVRDLSAAGTPAYSDLSPRVTRWLTQQGRPEAIAVLARAGVNYGIAREFAGIAALGAGRIEVFEDEVDALIWLTNPADHL